MVIMFYVAQCQESTCGAACKGKVNSSDGTNGRVYAHTDCSHFSVKCREWSSLGWFFGANAQAEVRAEIVCNICGAEHQIDQNYWGWPIGDTMTRNIECCGHRFMLSSRESGGGYWVLYENPEQWVIKAQQEEQRRALRRLEKQLAEQEKLERKRRHEEQLAEQKRMAEQLKLHKEEVAEQKKIEAQRAAEEKRKHDEEKAELRRAANEEKIRLEKKRLEDLRLKSIESELKSLRMSQKNCLDLQEAIKEKIGSVEEQKEKCDFYREKMEDEEKHLSKFKLEKDNPLLKRNVAWGVTGVGKSTVLNRLCGDYSEDGNQGPFKVSNGMDSETQKISKYAFPPGNEKYSVVDCPGICDSNGNDRHHANQLIQYLRGCGGVNAFFLFCNNANCRYDTKFQEMLETLQKQLSPGFWKHVIIIVTHVDTKRAIGLFNEGLGKDLPQRIKEHFKFKCNLPIVGINSFENYEEKLEKILGFVKDEKFMCENLVSPIEQLKKQFESENNKLISLNEKLTSDKKSMKDSKTQTFESIKKLKDLKYDKISSTEKTINNLFNGFVND